MPRFAAVIAVLAISSFTLSVSADDSTLKVKEGDPFPNVPLVGAQIEKVKPGAQALSVADLKGKTVVIFFYPAAMTKGCTTESCGFTNLSKEFPENVVILGASADPVEKQQEFAKKEVLSMPLLSDPDLKLIKELGILRAPNGKTSKRITFVVNKDGKIAKIYEPGKIDVNKHPKEVLEFVKTLK